MEFLEYLADNTEDLLQLTYEHIVITVTAVGTATLIGMLLGILTYRTGRPRELSLAVTGTFLTIPSLALYGILAAWPQFGLGLGATSVLVALTLYGLLPIVRNTIVGLREVDPAIVESAQGMGMGRIKRLLRIELPLAWPVILTGMRVSTLLLLGIATLGAYIRGPGLGNDIFAGLARIGTPDAVNLVLGGMLGVLVLAVGFDLLYVLINRLTTSRGLR
ncbi:MAG: ABC transporter permease subunit [Micromonosporaceae bacterium]|nr:ABC transporter permease subunit [Micromonosporaceae bacterium]